MAFSTRSGGRIRTQSALAEINITPLVDVVLVLLLIFMLTAPVLQSGVEVAVPHTRSVSQLTEQRTVVTIDKNQTRLSWAEQRRRPADQPLRPYLYASRGWQGRSGEARHLPARR